MLAAIIGMQLVGVVLTVASAVFNGSFTAFSKARAASLVHPFVFNLYLSFGVCLSSWIVAPCLPLIGSPPLVCPLGALAGLIFVGASSLSFVAVKHVGLSSGQGVFGGVAIIISFMWGTLGPSPIGQAVISLPLSLVATALLLVGIGMIVACEPIGATAQRLLCKGSRPISNPPLLAVVEGPARTDVEDAGAGSSGKLSNRMIGFSSAVAVGVFGGSVLVPMGFLGPDYKGARALAFLPSFGIGCLAGASLLVAAWYFIAGAPAFGSRYTVLAGIASGVTWNLGNVCQLVAMSVYLVPYGVAYPILQASLVVSGVLGIAVFRELRDRAAIGIFFFASGLVVLGAILLGMYGPSPAAAAQQPSQPWPPVAPPAPSSMPVAPPPSTPMHDGETLIRLGKELTKIISIQLLGYLCAAASSEAHPSLLLPLSTAPQSAQLSCVLLCGSPLVHATSVLPNVLRDPQPQKDGRDHTGDRSWNGPLYRGDRLPVRPVQCARHPRQRRTHRLRRPAHVRHPHVEGHRLRLGLRRGGAHVKQP